MKKKRIYSEEEIEIKKAVGTALSKLNQALTFERAVGGHKIRELIKLSDKELGDRLVAQRNWLIDRVVRATLLDELILEDSRLSRKVSATLVKLEVKLSDRLVANRMMRAAGKFQG